MGVITMQHDSSKVKKVIVFKLKDEEYALSIEQVSSIERYQTITRVPQTAPFVKGVINLRGVVTPIIDLRARFGIEEIEPTEQSRIVIVYFDDMEVGLIVDVANDVIDIPEDIVEEPPEVVGAVNVDYIEGVAKMGDRLLILLNLQKVLTPDEIDALKQVEG
mgnify:CR=1 FL=1